MRVFADSSTVIALAQIGELSFLRKVFKKVHVTDVIENELLKYKYPETDLISRALGDWMEVVEVPDSDLEDYKKYGLGSGEASLLLLPPEVLMIIDDLNARRIAQVEGRRFTGLLGVIVMSVEKNILKKEKALEILEKLAESNFRMTVSLYKAVSTRIMDW